PLVIPANQTRDFTEHFALPAFLQVSVLGVAPHMHLIGKSIKSFGVTPVGDTQNYISIPHWDFHWQGFYMFPSIKVIPGGTNVYAQAHYDNTVANNHNPNNPPQDVIAGEGTADEMMIVYFIYTAYQPGDENITIDSTLLSVPGPQPYYTNKPLLSVFPNPAREKLNIKCFLTGTQQVTVDILGQNGNLITTLYKGSLETGYHILEYNLPELAPGQYTLSFRNGLSSMTEKFLIMR
ncbi:MAG: T9SS type A sorting domain-containing protein, partial [Sphingobacteriales bacterium]